MGRGKQIPTFIIIVAIIGILLSSFLVATQTNLIFKQQVFTKSIFLEPEHDTDGGYIRLVRDDRSPMVLEWVNFDNDMQYMFFSISEGEVIDQKVFFDTPILDRGQYFVGYEAKFLSGKVEEGTISFRVI